MKLETATIIGAVSALVIAIVVFITLLAKNQEGRLVNRYAKAAQNFFGFKYSLAEPLLKIFYVGITCYCIIKGIFTMFCKEYGYGDYMIWDGIVLILFYPLIVRFFYEMTLLFITLVKKITAIEAKLKDENPDGDKTSIFDLDREIILPAPVYPAGYAPYAPQGYPQGYAQGYPQGYAPAAPAAPTAPAAPAAPTAPAAPANAPKIIGYDVNTGAPIYENQ